MNDGLLTSIRISETLQCMSDETSDLEAKAAEVALTVRLPSATLDRIDALVKARPTRIPRHSWLLEAIHEKLYKEERVEGDLDVRWENSRDIGETARYRLRFLRHDREKRRPVVPMTVVGDDCLERCLVEWGCGSENTKGWIQKLKLHKSISMREIRMPKDRVGRYGFKALAWGIHLDLGDGREAFLFPDHPASLPDGTRGDRITIRTEDGDVEKDAIVTVAGKALIILGEHFWPPDSPAGTVRVEYRVASKKETQEIMNVYRQYIPD